MLTGFGQPSSDKLVQRFDLNRAYFERLVSRKYDARRDTTIEDFLECARVAARAMPRGPTRKRATRVPNFRLVHLCSRVVSDQP
jgi:hypothetical protein